MGRRFAELTPAPRHSTSKTLAVACLTASSFNHKRHEEMKVLRKCWVLPTALLVITSAGLVSQQVRISRFEHELAKMSQWIDQRVSSHHRQIDSREAGRFDTWATRFESRFKNLDPREDAMLLSIELRRFAQGLSTEECHRWLGDIGTLDLPRNLRKSLEAEMIFVLADRNPEELMLRLEHRLSERGTHMPWVLAKVFRKWCEIDAAAAIRWLDHQIAEGYFDSRELARDDERLHLFELVAIPLIAKHDMEAAAARFSGLSEGQRGDVISDRRIHSSEDALSWIEITRRSGKIDEHRSSTEFISSEMFRLGGYPEVSRLIERIAATREERNWITQQALRIGISNYHPPKPATYLETKEWIDQMAPEDRHSLAGAALACFQNHSKFEELAEIALMERELPGGEVMFYHFLRDSTERAPEMVGKLAETLKDPTQRREIMEALPDKPSSTIDPFADP